MLSLIGLALLSSRWKASPARWAACGLGVGLLFAAGPSSAAPAPSLVLGAAPAGDSGFVVERAGVHGDWLLSARLLGDVASAPLVLRNAQQETDRVVGLQVWTHALATLSVAHRFALGVSVPLVLAQEGDAASPSSTAAPRAASGPALGDLRLGGRAKLFGSRSDAETRADLALSLWTWLPTGAPYAGDGSVSERASAIVEIASPDLYLVSNAGVRMRPSATLPGALPTRVGTSLALGLAAGFFADRLQRTAIGTELALESPFVNGARLLDPRATVAHAFATAHHRWGGGPFEIGAAFGPGLGQGAGSAAFRVLALIGYAPWHAAPPPDEDRDGIPDKVDACVDIRGVASDDPRLNGCPRESPDRDGDGIPDDVDACPWVPGRATYDARTHGCPEPVASRRQEPPRAELEQQVIVIHQQVQFETDSAVLRPESDALLGDVRRVLFDHPELAVVEVQGHTDGTGAPARNHDLSQGRAESVVAWLVSHGIRANRLVARGYGPDRPIADNAEEEGRRRNRRVEFHVLRRYAP